MVTAETSAAQKNASIVSFLASLQETERDKVVSELSVGEVHAILAELDREYMANPWSWFLNELQTQDEATQAMRHWPDKDFLHDLVWVLDRERAVFIPKSRRMMVSWTIAAWAIYKARYWPHHAIFIQSETEEKAAFITDKRCSFLEKNLREPLLRRAFKAIRTHQGLIGRITYEATDSYVWAIPQGDDVIRSFTFSILAMDESEFQPEGPKALVSALPTLEKGAQLIVASTSNGPQGILADVCRDLGFTKFI